MKNILVTGGGGFVGTALVKKLIKNGCRVTVAGRNKYPYIEEMGVECLVGDISDKSFTDRICTGVDSVFHTAAKAGIWGRWEEYLKTNVRGTKNIVDSCKLNGVARLIYTSTPSVVFDREDITGKNESLHYADTFLCHYAKSKVMAEKYVLANNSESLMTCAIRPHLVWGPGDPHLMPRLVERGKQKQLRIVGDGSNLVDITYIDNVAHAHFLAGKHLVAGGNVCGNAYFIGQERPVNLWEWINGLFDELGIEPVVKRISFDTAYRVGAFLECLYRFLGKNTEPKMTRFLAFQLSHSHFFSHERAKNDFGYEPIVHQDEGKKRLVRWLKGK